MEKIIFFGLVIPILLFVLYLGVNAIMKGVSAKNANKSSEKIDDDKINITLSNEKNLSNEIEKLNQLLKEGVITLEEFEKAKKKLLDN
tara:strand:- start:529 stop:792 length:264 start_codon:yes stop_codon:yes gene_type:complete